ncbi:MAG: menaquinone biosynthesis decarboxylase [Nitrospinae bacterium]|nr:menaquinone biosynthesis decarboxylase [Nitrospinota bacterium]
MRYNSLGDFISLLETEGELVRIKEPVSPILEITEITDRVSKSAGGGKALLFENVEGADFPLLINAYGSKKRINLALGGNIEEIAGRISKLINMPTPQTIGEKLSRLKTVLEIGSYTPKISKGKAPCQEVVAYGEDVNLLEFPILQCWPGDAGRFITFPLVFTKSLKDGKRNVGMYRMQVYDKNSTGMHWHIHKGGAEHYRQHCAANKRMELAVAIGTDPAITYSATAPLPDGIDELLLAGFIREKGVELTRCKTVDIMVPAQAEIILEGYVDPNELKEEGPFGDHTGYYSLKGDYPVFHVTAITRRKNPIYFTTIVGKPPMEDCYMGKATERIFLPMLKMMVQEIADISMPWEGVFHNCVIVSIDKRYPMQAKKVMSALWGTGQMSFSKMLLLVDSDIDISNHTAVARHLLDTIDIERDITISEGILDVLDHSAPNALYGGKIGIDATRSIDGEPPRQEITKLSNGELTEEQIREISPDIVSAGSPFSDTKNRLILISIDKKRGFQARETAEKLLKNISIFPYNIMLFLDKDVDSKDFSTALWRLFNNVDPQKDMFKIEGLLIIDATKKLLEEGHNREWPEDIVMDKETIEKVDIKWPTLNIG